MCIRFFGLRSNLRRREPDALIDDIHADFPAPCRDLFGAVGMAVEARLAEHIGQLAPERLGNTLDVLADSGRIFLAIGLDNHGDARGCSEFAKHVPHCRAPFTCRDAGLRAGNRGLHDIGPVLCGLLQRGERIFNGACISLAAPFFQVANLGGFLCRVDRLDRSVAACEWALRRLDIAVDANHGQITALNRLDAINMCADEALLHMVDRLDCAAPRIEVSQRIPRQRLQLFCFGFDDMAAVEDVFVFQEVCFIGEDLLQTQRPLLVPRAWQARSGQASSPARHSGIAAPSDWSRHSVRGQSLPRVPQRHASYKVP